MRRPFIYTSLDDERYVAVVTMMDVTLMTEDILSCVQAWTRGETRNHVLVDAALLSGLSRERFVEFELSGSGCVMTRTGKYVIPSPDLADTANAVIRKIRPDLLSEDDDCSVSGAFRKKAEEERKDAGSAYGVIPVARWVLDANERQIETEGGERMGETKLQCLLYVLQKGYIIMTHRPLFDSDFIIADGIPIIREVRDIYGGSPSISYDESYGNEIPEKDTSVLETVFGLFSEYSGVGLKRMLRNDPAIAEASEGEAITKEAIIGRG